VTWQPIIDGVWSAEKRTAQGWSLRATAVRLADGGLLVVSPTRGLGDDAHAELAALGAPAALLAPNHYHYLGLAEWRERYPDARAFASEIAQARVRAKSGLDVEPLDALRPRLRAECELLEPDGTRAGEVWVTAPAPNGVAWIVADAFFHAAESPTGFTGWFLRRTKTVPGLCLGWTFLKLGLRDRRAYKRWLDERLENAPPAMMIFAHGEPRATPELADELRQLSRTRLPRL